MSRPERRKPRDSRGRCRSARRTTRRSPSPPGQLRDQIHGRKPGNERVARAAPRGSCRRALGVDIRRRRAICRSKPLNSTSRGARLPPPVNRALFSKSGRRFCLGKHDKIRKLELFRFNLNRERLERGPSVERNLACFLAAHAVRFILQIAHLQRLRRFLRGSAQAEGRLWMEAAVRRFETIGELRFALN